MNRFTRVIRHELAHLDVFEFDSAKLDEDPLKEVAVTPMAPGVPSVAVVYQPRYAGEVLHATPLPE